MEVVKGLRKLKLWVQRENNQQVKQRLKQFYNIHIEEVQKMKKYLEDHKETVQQDQGDQMYRKKGKGSKKQDDKDKKKSEDQIMDALVSKKPNVKWDDVAGLVNAKKAL